jgi:signal transduction histidine kinase
LITAAPQRDQHASVRATLLLVGGDAGTAKLVTQALRGAREWSLVRRADAHGHAALEQPPRLVLLAAGTPASQSLAAVTELKRQFPMTPILVLGEVSRPDAARLGAAGARGCLDTRALTPFLLQRAMQHALAAKPAAAQFATPAAMGLLQTSPTFGALLSTTDGQIRACNPRLLAMLGYRSNTELVGRHLVKDLGLDPALLASCSSEIQAVPVELSLRRSDGAVLHARGDLRARRDAAGAALALELVLADCTEEHRLQLAMIGASRTEALRALTGGAAHDLNNLLTIIVGNLYLLVESLRDDESQLNKVKAARDAARRGSDLARQLLSFATQKSVPPEVTELAPVVRNLELLLARALGQRIELRTELAPDCWPICVDVTQFESAIINLAVNARDAMTGAGRVTVTVENHAIDHPRAAELGIECGEYVAVAVADNGPGIPEAIRDHIFTPFFTTKQESGGSGLGLSMVRRLAMEAGGAVEVVPAPGGGACFRLLFPRAAADSLRNTEMTQPLSTLPAGTERILVQCADDDVATTIHQLLSVLGYTVDVTSDAAMLPELIRGSSSKLLVWELGPHGANHPLELLTLLEQAGSDLKLLLVGDEPPSVHPAHPRIKGQLRKPLVLAELATSVRRALDAPG